MFMRENNINLLISEIKEDNHLYVEMPIHYYTIFRHIYWQFLEFTFFISKFSKY